MCVAISVSLKNLFKMEPGGEVTWHISPPFLTVPPRRTTTSLYFSKQWQYGLRGDTGHNSIPGAAPVTQLEAEGIPSRTVGTKLELKGTWGWFPAWYPQGWNLHTWSWLQLAVSFSSEFIKPKLVTKIMSLNRTKEIRQLLLWTLEV